ncbi:MAG: stage 0 sporulation family protein [Oscillospiraceae bacterium]
MNKNNSQNNEQKDDKLIINDCILDKTNNNDPSLTENEQTPIKTEVVGVRFKDVGKTYYFDPGNLKLSKTNKVIVETARGIECGDVVNENRFVPTDTIVHPLKKVIRIATNGDIKQLEENKLKEKEAFDICQEKITKHKLKMKLVETEYTFDRNKILFYFTSDNRVDFRELVKDLAAIFRTRIELRQIGVRDQAKMLGGLGICGKAFCCATFLGEFQPVSIKMAKEQSLSLNPTKISGTCGRLMCCLKYEQDVYEELLVVTPKVGAFIKTPEGNGTVIENNLLTGSLKVRMEKDPGAAPKIFNRKQVQILRDVQFDEKIDNIDELKELFD